MRIIKKTKSISVLLHGAVVIPVLGLVSAVPLHAQVTSGSIVGVVYDQSGAAIPNSTVTATDAATGAAREVETNTSGYYTILSLPPDPYKVTASATGFAVTNAQIVVALGQAANFRFPSESRAAPARMLRSTLASSQLELETTDHQVASLLSQSQHREPSGERKERLPNAASSYQCGSVPECCRTYIELQDHHQ